MKSKKGNHGQSTLYTSKGKIKKGSGEGAIELGKML